MSTSSIAPSDQPVSKRQKVSANSSVGDLLDLKDKICVDRDPNNMSALFIGRKVDDTWKSIESCKNDELTPDERHYVLETLKKDMVTEQDYLELCEHSKSWHKEANQKIRAFEKKSQRALREIDKLKQTIDKLNRKIYLADCSLTRLKEYVDEKQLYREVSSTHYNVDIEDEYKFLYRPTGEIFELSDSDDN